MVGIVFGILISLNNRLFADQPKHWYHKLKTLNVFGAPALLGSIGAMFYNEANTGDEAAQLAITITIAIVAGLFGAVACLLITGCYQSKEMTSIDDNSNFYGYE